MAKNIELLRQEVAAMRNEVEDFANSAERVGGVMSDVLEYGHEQLTDGKNKHKALAERVTVAEGAISAEVARAQAAEGNLLQIAVRHQGDLDGIKPNLESAVKGMLDNEAAIAAEVQARSETVAALQDNTGISEYPAFSPTADYAVEDVVNYEGRLYKFITEHARGPWIGTNTEEWSEKKEMLYNISPRPIRLLEQGTHIGHTHTIAITGEIGSTVRTAMYELPSNKFTLRIKKTGNEYQRIYGYTDNREIGVASRLYETSEEMGNRGFMSIEINPLEVPYKYIVVGYDEEGGLPVIIERGRGGIKYNSIYTEAIQKDAVTTSKIANASVTTDKIEDESIVADKIFNSIFSEKGAKYRKKISELWIDPKYKIEGGDCRVKTTNYIYVRVYHQAPNTALYWNCCVPLPDTNTYNNTPIPLVVSNVGSGYDDYMGKVVGYIVLTDASPIEEDGGKGDKISDNIFKIGNFPIINEYIGREDATRIENQSVTTEKIQDRAITTDKIEDGAITTDKIEDGAITTEKIQDGAIIGDTIPDKNISVKKIVLEPKYYTTKNLYDYTGAVSELYIRPELIPEGAVLFSKGYSNTYYVRPYISGKRQWNASVVLSSVENGDVAEIICTTAGENVNVGDTVGYVVFLDKQIVIDAAIIDDGRGEEVDIQEVTALLPWGKIKDYIKGIDGSLIKEQSITTEKIADKAITAEKLADNVNIQSAIEAGLGIALPDEIITVEGDCLQIFWRSIIHAFNPYILDIISVCSVGYHYPRYFYFTPKAEHVGKTYTLEVVIRDNNLKTIASKTTTIKIVAKPKSPITKTNILCIGASATASGNWAYEVMRRLTMTNGDSTPVNPIGLGLENIYFVGRKRGSDAEIQLEATGGWRVQDYAGKGRLACRFYVTGVNQLNIGDTYSDGVTIFVVSELNITEGEGNIRCVGGDSAASASGILSRVNGNGDKSITYTFYESESYNPFYNLETDKIDFVSYADAYCNGSIDVQLWHCGVNDIFGGKESTIPVVIDAYKSILRAYHSQFPNGKVIISSVPIGSVNGGFGANYGASESANYFTFLNIAQKYALALSELCNDEEFSAFTKYAAVLEEFDAENGYPVSQTNVNNRQEVKVDRGTNGVHPTKEGSYMVADSIYRAFANL